MAAFLKMGKCRLLLFIFVGIMGIVVAAYLKSKIDLLSVACETDSRRPSAVSMFTIWVSTIFNRIMRNIKEPWDATNNIPVLPCNASFRDIISHVAFFHLPEDIQGTALHFAQMNSDAAEVTVRYIQHIWENYSELALCLFGTFATLILFALCFYRQRKKRSQYKNYDQRPVTVTPLQSRTAGGLFYHGSKRGLFTGEETEDKSSSLATSPSPTYRDSKDFCFNTFTPRSCCSHASGMATTASSSERVNCLTGRPDMKYSPGNHRQRVSPWCATICLVMMLACMSIPWEFVRLYQKAVGNRAAVASVGLPPECQPGTLSFLQTMRVWLSQQLAWSHGNPCDQYYYAVFVDPLWEITPFMVLMSAVTRCIVHPAEMLLSGLGRGFRSFFTEIPVHWQPVFMLTLLFTLLIMLLMTCSYRLSIPLLFRIEPKTPVFVQQKRRKNGEVGHCSAFVPSIEMSERCTGADWLNCDGRACECEKPSEPSGTRPSRAVFPMAQRVLCSECTDRKFNVRYHSETRYGRRLSPESKIRSNSEARYGKGLLHESGKESSLSKRGALPSLLNCEQKGRGRPKTKCSIEPRTTLLEQLGTPKRVNASSTKQRQTKTRRAKKRSTNLEDS